MRQAKIFRKPTITTGQKFSLGYADQPGALGVQGGPSVYDVTPRVVAGNASILGTERRNPSWTYNPGADLPFGFAEPEWSKDV